MKCHEWKRCEDDLWHARGVKMPERTLCYTREWPEDGKSNDMPGACWEVCPICARQDVLTKRSGGAARSKQAGRGGVQLSLFGGR